jgi:tellurite resistance protein TerC
MIGHTVGNPALWTGFFALIIILLLVDLGVFGRRSTAMSLKAAFGYSAIWIAIALGFNVFVYSYLGKEAGLEFLTGYLIEKALSVDNIFVFLVLFKYFAVPKKLQHRVLFFGIAGAVLMRGIFIFGGAALIEKFFWLTYILGILLVYTAYKLIKEDPEEINPDDNKAVKLARKFFRSTDGYREKKFFVRENGVLLATPLLFVLIAVETTDLIFAVDSIPAIFAITTDPFIVLTSNIFAILGLRALYFLLASILAGLRFLRYGLSTVLLFIGLKMLVHSFLEISTITSLLVIASVLGSSILASLAFPGKKEVVEAVQD